MIADQFEDVFRYEAWEDQPRDDATPFSRAVDDIFRYVTQAAPKPTTASRRKPPEAGAGMGAVKSALGLPAKIPSPFPPAAATQAPNAVHPEAPSTLKVPQTQRSGNLATQDQRLPRAQKRYKLQVPMKESYERAHDEIAGEMNKATHPEEKERYREEIEDLEKVFVSGSERLMTRFLEDHVGWKTFNHLVQSLKDQEPAVTSRPGLYARADEDIFQGDTMDEKPVKPAQEQPKTPDGKPLRPRPFAFPRPRGYSSIPGILLDIAAREKAGKASMT